jgi:hypothetical protein
MVGIVITANSDQTKPKFFVKAQQSGAFTKNLVVGLFSICCRPLERKNIPLSLEDFNYAQPKSAERS